MAKKRTHFLIEGLFGLEGRMRRSEFWLMSIGMGVFKFLLTLVISSVIGGDMADSRTVAVRFVVDVLFFWPVMAFAVRRGHDRNRATLYSIVLTVIMAIFGYAMILLMGPISAAGQNPDPGALLAFASVWLVYVILAIYWFVDYGCLDGTKGRNRFGPSPKGVKGPDEQDVAKVFA
ncbi:DUF805 domain-containing protein [Caulobacter hibisci]|uniref:DUF805 domain-containing protein n=1 Tax=Caulobacter hibisci TaxID=2035993 RepID=A0ABS0SUZ1_9CAUL|nr:DUF805 domain-containing protein [Caulobacter hibisci]MBI1682447.1 DUF805 domain-containing protein [Caulobacter hibisci]